MNILIHLFASKVCIYIYAIRLAGASAKLELLRYNPDIIQVSTHLLCIMNYPKQAVPAHCHQPGDVDN